MMIGWIVATVSIALGLSIGAVAWDWCVEIAQRNERTRIWVRRVLLMEAADELTGQIVNLANWTVNAAQVLGAALAEILRLVVEAGLVIGAILWAGGYLYRHATTQVMRLGTVAMVVVCVVAVVAMVWRRISAKPSRWRS